MDISYSVGDAPKPFDPVTLHIKCETQAEVDAIHNLFNCTHIIQALVVNMGRDRRDDDFATIARNALRDAQGAHMWQERNFHQFYAEMCRQFTGE